MEFLDTIIELMNSNAGLGDVPQYIIDVLAQIDFNLDEIFGTDYSYDTNDMPSDGTYHNIEGGSANNG